MAYTQYLMTFAATKNKSIMRKHYLSFFLVLFVAFTASAQVTTSSINGVVKDVSGKALEGATISATHTPSGTVYTTISKKLGVFNLPSVRIGGPYTIVVNYVGYGALTVENINLQLGEPYFVNALMNVAETTLSGVVVSGRRSKLGADKTGAATNVGQRQITTLPTISRSITDFTRLTPQANGTSFAGRDGRYNNIQVDGANLNNNFGLSSAPLPGGGNQPISLDAYEEISINIAPFDVRQAGFTGAGINAVTKSGTNTFKGSAYRYNRNQNYNGRNVGDIKLPEQALSESQTIGFTIGGPIIKNKLFFFASAERETGEFPGIPWKPKGGTGAGNESTTPVDSLKKFSDFLRSKYGYETGAYDNFQNFQSENYKILAKIDWNISKVHKLTLKYNEMLSENDAQLNATSVPNGGGFTVTGRAGSLSRLTQNRFGINSMSFQNSNYRFKDVVKSATLELNSNVSGRFSNQFLATYTKIQATRSTPSALFPMIDIFNGAGDNYMSAGLEPFSNNNDVINNIFSFINNSTWFRGNHTITAGASYEGQRVGNMFMPGSQSYYIFSSLNDFITDQAPAYYAYTYSLVPGQKAVYSAELKIGQLGLYAQDDWAITDNFKLTYGLRLDRPIYNSQPIANPKVTELSFPDASGNPTNYNTGAWPKSRFLASPRVGFRWDVEGNKDLIVRGGTGIFTGKIPFVWLTNVPTNSGMYQFGANVRTASALQNYRFNPDPDAYASTFPNTAGTSVPANIVMTDPNFKFPQIFRTNLAFDKRFGQGWLFSMEAIYTKDINAVRMRNANEKPTNGILTGSDARGRFVSSNDRRLYSNITSAVVLENTNKGGGFSFTTQLSKSFANGFYGSFAYTYTTYNEVTSNPGSQASSAWNSNPNVGTQNALELYNSAYVIPHRIIGTLSYRKEYIKHLATTFSLFYEGASQGLYTYTVSGDLNNDGNSVDLMYIPKDANDIIFVAQAASSTANAYTAQQQSDAFFQFVENVPHLRKNKGSYAQRNGAALPWYDRVDVKILQDLFTNIGKRRNTIQISLDILNFTNMLNKDWGVIKRTTVTNPLIFAGYNAAGAPTYRMSQINKQLVTQPFQTVQSTASTWGMQFGVRYIF
jgi:outer membrane receptor protein involved in Fe transport